MLERWYPTAHVPSVFAIDYEKLAALGYKGILFDIDNTLVHHGDDSTPEVDALFRHIHSLGLKTLLLSDNSAVRIERFNRNIRTLFIGQARPRCLPPGLRHTGPSARAGRLRRRPGVPGYPRREQRRAGQHPGGFHPAARRDALWQKACAGKSHPLVLPP